METNLIPCPDCGKMVSYRAKICPHCGCPVEAIIKPATVGYIDLGLPSGTKWKEKNESNPKNSHGFFTYDEAKKNFGSNLPTREQLNELKDKCTWIWNKDGYNVFGPNGNSIFLSAAGYCDCNVSVYLKNSYGGYWSSTPGGPDIAWYLYFRTNGVYINNNGQCYGRSVRLVKN